MSCLWRWCRGAAGGAGDDDGAGDGGGEHLLVALATATVRGCWWRCQEAGCGAERGGGGRRRGRARRRRRGCGNGEEVGAVVVGMAGRRRAGDGGDG